MSNNIGDMVLLEKVLLGLVILMPLTLLITPLYDIFIFNISILAWLPLVLLFIVPSVGIYVALTDKKYEE